MKIDFRASMREAVRLTRAHDLAEATRIIQRALLGREGNAPSARPATTAARDLELTAEPAGTPVATTQPSSRASSGPRTAPAPTGEPSTAGRVKRPLGEVLQLLAAGKRLLEDRLLPDERFAPLNLTREQAPLPVADGAIFETRTFACAAGSRDYKLYVPAAIADPRPALVVMLHGCKQNPDDFAIGTGMNRLADKFGFVVAYPRQTAKANQSRCWNWFNPADQRRESGEPSILAGLTRAIIADCRIDETRVYVAGLSAGAAMAAVMAATYPDLYAAVGVHSGLPHGAANDVASAFAAMRGHGRGTATPAARNHDLGAAPMRTIVFHGSADRTVHPANAQTIVARAGGAVPDAVETRQQQTAAGRDFTRTVIADRDGTSHVEHWDIQGLGHAWSGGHPAGSYTDPAGPDASHEMVRFFLDRTPLRRQRCV